MSFFEKYNIFLFCAVFSAGLMPRKYGFPLQLVLLAPVWFFITFIAIFWND